MVVRRARLWPLVIVLLAAAVAVGWYRLGRAPGRAALPTDPAGLAANAVVVHLVDGDTIDATIGGTRERIRLLGVDTPETKKENTPVQCYGPEASSFTAQLLPVGTPIYLERDVVGRDDYGRLLAYVYRVADRIMVNLELLRGGYARPFPYRPNTTHADEFADAAAAAERAHLGLWGACPATTSG